MGTRETNGQRPFVGKEGMDHPTLGLATWNIRGFARPDFNDLAKVLNDQPLALIVAQELQRSQAKRLATLLGMHHLWSLKHSPLGPLVRFAEGLALFSVDPLNGFETLNLTPKVGGFSHRRRIAQFAYLDRHDADVVNIHLASHTDSPARIEQLRVVLDRVHFRGANRCIMAGDFNGGNEPLLYNLLEQAGFSDAWLTQANTDTTNQTEYEKFDASNQTRFASTGNGFTNPTESATSRLDRIFVRGFMVRSATIPIDDKHWPKRSDHLPVFARLQQERASFEPT